MSRHAVRPRRAPAAKPRFAAPLDRAAPASAAHDPQRDRRTAALLWAGLAGLTATRAAATLVPTMALWGWNVHRFVGPVSAWISWGLMAMSLLPWVARPLAVPVSAAGLLIVQRPGVASVLAAMVAGALVWAFPDRLHFVGDSMLRLGALARGENPLQLSPQAYPLDVLVHYAAPFELVRSGRAAPQTIVLAIGAAGAALLGAASVGMARALEASPAARMAAAAVALFGGYLCLFTGENKAFAEMVVIVVVFAACTFAAVRDAGNEGRAGMPAVIRGETPWSLLGAGACVAIGVLFHRFALGLIPAWILAWALWARTGRSHAAAAADRAPRSFLRRTIALVVLLAPIVVLAAMAPRIADTIVRYDLSTNFANAEARGEGGVVAAALAPARLLDVLNLIFFLSPLAIAAALVAPWRPRRSGAGDPAAATRARQGGIALAIAAPFLGVFLFARPPQGLVRDWDSFATAAAALSVLSAWVLARAIDRSGRAWLAVPVIAVAATCSYQWLAHHADEPRGLTRLEALMLEPPARTVADRARTWDVLGWRYFSSQRYEASVRAFEHAAEAAPSPRNLTHWAMAEVMTGDHRRAVELYSLAAERDTNFVLAWMGLGASAINAGDWPAAERAGHQLIRLAPDHEQTQAIVRHLAEHARQQ